MILQSSGVLYPLLGWRLQISLLEIDALNERLYRQNIIDGTVCRLWRRDISCRTNLVGTSYGTFLTGQEPVDVVGEEYYHRDPITDLCYLGEHDIEVIGLLVPPAENVLGL